MAKVDSVDHHPKREVEDSIQQIMSQPFYYLDQGLQSYVFLSEDKKYVLKFFKVIRGQNKSRVNRKLKQLMEGYQLAYEEVPENTGLIYIHLTSLEVVPKPTIVFDRLGMKHEMDTSSVMFAIQLKGISARKEISRLLNEKDVKGAKIRFREIIDLYLSMYKEGVYDTDYNVMYNSGFIGDRSIRLDVGRLKYDEKFKNRAVALEDLRKVENRINGWMDRHFPKYKKTIAQDLADSL